ncbi:uncharacterized protein BXZ73DRAFT_54666 [Epithele typhae]|uniref:uncharacterized protein n=1 Tax=Epithele typhae TaxID=378194 RepID=UPI0020074F60|nr:uncharacterized protein BXZ73DRAFT_54666 [Epithele typhae]KAH9914895.1 hypothetical protein BXZ73DRAFT_54666 [Epithele typhae]
MRRCLDCVDILRNICEQAYDGGYNPENRAAVAALNATCRAFSALASKVLWSRLFSLRPLVKCLPTDVWHTDVQNVMDSGALILSRPPDPHDWTRFLEQAARVTSFKRFGPTADLDDDTYRTLCLYHPGPRPLLPHLEELVWEESDADVFEYGIQFLGPKLTSIHIGQPPSDTLLLPILRALDPRCPVLRHLSVQCRASVGPVDPVVSRAIVHLHHLETIDLSLPLFDDALLHLASLKTLAVAKIFLYRETKIHERLREVRSPSFPALSVLHLGVVLLEPSLSVVIDAITSTQLSEVELCAAHDPVAAHLRMFLAALARSPSRDAIAAVRLVFPLPSSISLMCSLSAIPPLDDPTRILTLDTFTPLTGLSELIELDITSFFLKPDDAFLSALPSVCPDLQVLHLAHPYNAGLLPTATLDGVLRLLQQYPELTELTLAFDAARSYAALALSSHWTCPSLHTLDVRDSPLLNPDELAAALSAHCTSPHLALHSARAHEGSAAPELVAARTRHAALWDQAARLVRLFGRVRAQERAWVQHAGR